MRFSIFKHCLALLVITTLVSGVTLFAKGNNGKKPAVKKGAKVIKMKGHVRAWKEVDTTPLNARKKTRRLRPVMNFDRNLPLVKKSSTPDPVVQSTHGKPGLKRSALTPDPDISFDGMNLNSNGAGWPPDTTGDVGDTYFVQAVNSSMAIYRKSTGALVSSATFDDFFEGGDITGTPCDEDNNGDPIVLYDQYNDRWFILDFAWDSSENDGSYYAIAVSQTSDPTGSWYQYAFRADDTLMNDYPKCGVWHDGIYITANMFSFSGSFQYSKVWAIKTPDLYSGTLTAQSLTDSSDEAFSIMPANAKGTNAPPSSAPNYMYAIDADEYGTGHSDALSVWKMAVDWTNSSNTTWTGPSTLSVASYDLTASAVPQSGTSNTLDSLYGRLMFGAMYRNFNTYESVYLCHLAEYSSRRAMRWYEIRIASETSSIYQQGTYSPDSDHRWMGSVGADKNGSIAMGYSVSSSSMYPSIRYAARLSTDTLGELSQGEATLVTGSGYQSSYSRWGDYSTITIDPTDDETFWYTQEYYSSSGTNWNTRIGSFKLSSTPDTTPPVISDVTAGSITSSGCTITWTTDESASSEVEYGTTTSYGSSETDSSYVTSHSITLTGLTEETTYHYKVVSEDASGNSDESSDYTFTTGTGGTTGDTLAEAVDYDTLTFTLSGDADWGVDTSEYYYGNDSALSGSMTDDESCSMSTTLTITEAKTLTFYWKVSSESSYDYLNFYIDGSLQDQVSGTVDWTQQSYSLSAGTYTLTWEYDKDYSVSSGSDCGWVDRLELEAGSTTTDDLGEALDNSTVTTSTSGDGLWIVDTSEYYYDNDSIVSPGLTHSEDASVEITVSGVTSISFYWQVSSERRYDYLNFYIDGVRQNRISGTRSWAQKSYTVDSGSHTLKWTYSKDSSVSSNDDCGWVDRLVLN